jgi:hypothetical protein
VHALECILNLEINLITSKASLSPHQLIDNNKIVIGAGNRMVYLDAHVKISSPQ